MRHLSTQITDPGGPACRSTGQTFWAWQTTEGGLGMAWDWVQLGHGVLALADPMAVITNLRLVGDEGTVLSAQESVMHVNSIVHSLPWQTEVERALDRQGSARGANPRPTLMQ